MSLLLLIRHSQVAREAQGSAADWPLSSEGSDLCVPLAEALRPFEPDLLISSTMRRARETAELVAGTLGIGWRTAQGLEEHRRPYVPAGRRSEEDFETLMQRLFAKPDERVFGEESADEARDRFASAVETIVEREAGSNVGIVSHGTVLAVYAAPFFGMEPIDLWRRLDWPSFLVIDLESRQGIYIVDSVLRVS